jgi:hypothetical protein
MQKYPPPFSACLFGMTVCYADLFYVSVSQLNEILSIYSYASTDTKATIALVDSTVEFNDSCYYEPLQPAIYSEGCKKNLKNAASATHETIMPTFNICL